MRFTPVEPGLACWRLAHTFSDFYPPDESVEGCLEDNDTATAREKEQWYHERKCEVYQYVIEALYDRGVDVWNLGQEHVENGPHPDSTKQALSLPSRPPVLDDSSDPEVSPDDAFWTIIDEVKEQLQSAATMDEQIMWTDVLSDLTDESTNDIGEWLREQGEQSTIRRDAS